MAGSNEKRITGSRNRTQGLLGLSHQLDQQILCQHSHLIFELFDLKSYDPRKSLFKKLGYRYMPYNFLNSHHTNCIGKIGNLADQAGPWAPLIHYSSLCSWLIVGEMLHWPIAGETRDSVQALLSPFLGWVAFLYTL